MLVYFFCTLFQFVCCIKCNAGGAPPAGIAFYAADKLKKRAEKVNKHIEFEGVVSKATAMGVKGLDAITMVPDRTRQNFELVNRRRNK